MTATLLFVALLSTPPGSPEALYRAGSDAYRAGRYDVAITAFEAALARVDRPDLLFSVAQAHRLQYFAAGGSAHLEAAVRAYRDYLARVPDGKRRVHAAQHLSTLVPYLERMRIEGAEAQDAAGSTTRIIVTSTVPDAVARVGDGVVQPVPAAFEVEPGAHRVEVSAPLHVAVVREVAGVEGTAVAITVDPPPVPGRLALTAPEGARVLVDGRRVGVSPIAGPIDLEPGLHDLVVLARGRRPVVQAIDLGRGQSLDVAVDLEPTTQRWLALAAMGAAAALGVSGVGTGYFAYDARSEAEAMEGRVGAGLTAADLARYRQLEQQRDDLRDVTIGLGVAATGLLATGVALWFFDEPVAPPRRVRGPAPPRPSDPYAAR